MFLACAYLRSGIAAAVMTKSERKRLPLEACVPATDFPVDSGQVSGVKCTLRAQDWSRLRIQSLLYHSQGPLGKDYFRTTIFFPANFVTLLAVI